MARWHHDDPVFIANTAIQAHESDIRIDRNAHPAACLENASRDRKRPAAPILDRARKNIGKLRQELADLVAMPELSAEVSHRVNINGFDAQTERGPYFATRFASIHGCSGIFSA